MTSSKELIQRVNHFSELTHKTLSILGILQHLLFPLVKFNLAKNRTVNERTNIESQKGSFYDKNKFYPKLS